MTANKVVNGVEGDGRGQSDDMQDDYGEMQAPDNVEVLESVELENGQVLAPVHVAYKAWGSLNKECDNVIVVCHAFSGSHDVESFWKGILGAGLALDTSKYFVLCSNVLGSCYGTTGPNSMNPRSGRKFGKDFPSVTVRDAVKVQALLLKQLGVKGVVTVIGGSYGGMQTLEWAFIENIPVRSIIPIATTAAHNAWQIGLSEAQRQCVYADPLWKDGEYEENHPPSKGLAAARMMQIIPSRTAAAYSKKFGRERGSENSCYQVESYLRYQGGKFVDRFDALTFVRLTETLDTHDVGRGRGGLETALRSIKQRCLVIGFTSDILYPLEEQKLIAKTVPGATLCEIDSLDGHDGFLLEHEALNQAIPGFLNSI